MPVSAVVPMVTADTGGHLTHHPTPLPQVSPHPIPRSPILAVQSMLVSTQAMDLHRLPVTMVTSSLQHSPLVTSLLPGQPVTRVTDMFPRQPITRVSRATKHLRLLHHPRSRPHTTLPRPRPLTLPTNKLITHYNNYIIIIAELFLLLVS